MREEEEEAKRLRDIVDVLDDHYNDFPKDSTNTQSYWFHWAAQEIRQIISNSRFNAFNDEKCGTTTTKEKYHSRRTI